MLLLLALTMNGCASLDLKNAGKTTVTTGVTYAVAGPVPAVANVLTSMAYDEVAEEIIPEPDLEEVQSTEQAIAFIADKTLMYTLYGIIVFLLFTNVITPFFAQRRAIRRERFNRLEEEYRNQNKRK